MMFSNAIGGFRDAGRVAGSPAYGAAVDGLRAFDDLTAVVRARQDGVRRSVTAAAGYSHTPPGSAVGAPALAAAVAAYARSDAGREKLEALASGAAALLGRFCEAGSSKQLQLPLEG